MFVGRRWSPKESIWPFGCSYMVVIWFYCYSFLHRQFSSFPYRVEAWDSRRVTRRFSKTIQDSILANARFGLDDLFWTDGKYWRKILWVGLSAIWVLWFTFVNIYSWLTWHFQWLFYRVLEFGKICLWMIRWLSTSDPNWRSGITQLVIHTQKCGKLWKKQDYHHPLKRASKGYEPLLHLVRDTRS